jgi:crotonobetainyl-CoA:carnitine CoA-transferase CaiB-like acyl-CoA transferase
VATANERRPRVADFSTHLSGPFASHLLVDLGADVVKIENPRNGDGNRGVVPMIEGVGNMHVALGPGTRSLAVDRRSEHWPRVVEAAARWADVVIVGSRPSDAIRRGIGFETFQAANPRIVYCLISGYGESGPWADVTAHGQSLDAFAGLVRHEVVDGRPVTSDGWRSTGTTLAGVYAALGIMGALYKVQLGAPAQYVHVSIWNAGMSWQWRDLTTLANLDETWPEYRDLGSRYCLYATKDDRAILFAPCEKKFWDTFCDLVGLPERKEIGEWSSGMDFGKGVIMEEERRIIGAKVREKTRDEWVEVFLTSDVPFAPILTPQEAMSSEHARVNHVMAETSIGGATVQVPTSPVTIRDAGDTYSSRPPTEPYSPPPGIGEQTDEVLRDFGLDDLAGSL